MTCVEYVVTAVNRAADKKGKLVDMWQLGKTAGRWE